ncbi:MAG: hypothetical protein J6D11_06230 [Clostridia bacterium]|nr:hypothetical protein [Clostridia bacterium]
MAAVAMLLVAFFMVISSSYAWFTLSTAPEVTGIYTAVGANGNLEIALWSETIPDSTVNDSTKALVDRNLTWGNLIDLNHEAYGLSKVSLLPSRLNIGLSGTDYQVASLPLLTPTYGSDGRISTLTANTILATYDTQTQSFLQNDDYGVRAIGTSTTMSQQQMDFRNAKYEISTAVDSAKTKAAQSLTANGSALASILSKKATEDSTTTYDLSCADNLITQLGAANAEIEKAIRAYIVAVFAIANQTTPENDYGTAKAALETQGLSALMAEGTAWYNSIPQAVKDAYTQYTINATAITNAGTALATVKTTHNNDITAVTWDEVSDVLIDTDLVNIEGAKLNGYAANDVKNNLGDIISKVASQGVLVELDDNGGVYSNIAKVCGEYSADVTIEKIEYGGLALDNMAARMTTKVTVSYDIYAAVPAKGPSSNTSSTPKLTDFYGYVVDLAFRTNAADSKLMLQTNPVNRIYTEGGSQETMGHGSTMTFESLTTDFTTANVLELMSAIRIVFTDASGNIVAVGLLDTENEAVVGTEVTANVRLCNFTFEDKGTGENHDYRIKITTTTGEGATETISWKDDGTSGKAEIMALTKNQATRLSAYVYLDGDLVDNTMVANAASSMTGTLNLQFSSDKTLTPMPYAPLQNQTPAQGGEGGGAGAGGQG